MIAVYHKVMGEESGGPSRPSRLTPPFRLPSSGTHIHPSHVFIPSSIFN